MKIARALTPIYEFNDHNSVFLPNDVGGKNDALFNIKISPYFGSDIISRKHNRHRLLEDICRSIKGLENHFIFPALSDLYRYFLYRNWRFNDNHHWSPHGENLW